MPETLYRQCKNCGEFGIDDSNGGPCEYCGYDENPGNGPLRLQFQRLDRKQTAVHKAAMRWYQVSPHMTWLRQKLFMEQRGLCRWTGNSLNAYGCHLHHSVYHIWRELPEQLSLVIPGAHTWHHKKFPRLFPVEKILEEYQRNDYTRSEEHLARLKAADWELRLADGGVTIVDPKWGYHLIMEFCHDVLQAEDEAA